MNVSRPNRLICLVFCAVWLASCAVPTTATLPSTPQAASAEELPQPTNTPFIRRLEVYPEQPLQTIREVGGGNFIHMFGGVTQASDPVSDTNLAQLNPSVVRVSINLDEWEPQNENSDQRQMAETGFVDEEGTFIRGTFEFLRDMQARGAILVASVWRVPGWLVENPEDESQQIIPEELYPEAVESLAAWLLHAKKVYGVEIAYISFNEANLGINVLLEPQNYIALIRQAGPRFQELDLNTKWLLADSSNMASTLSYARQIWAAEDIRPFLGVLAFHSWDAAAADGTLRELAQFAQDNNLDVWVTEGGWDPSMWQRPKDFPTWMHAIQMASVYSRVLKLTRATTLLYWQMMGQDYTLNDGSQPYMALKVIRAMQTYFPAGGQILQTSPDHSTVKFTAQKSAGGFSVVIINQSSFAEQVQLTGLPDGNYRWVRFSTTEDSVGLGNLGVTNGLLQFELAKSSVNFFTTLQP